MKNKKQLKNSEIEEISYKIQTFFDLIPPQKPINETYKVKGGYVSFNPNTDAGAETALCLDDERFFILLGDFRKNIKGIETMKDCIKIFKNLLKTKKAKESLWSSY
jgi:hypothetical protein